MEIFNIDPSDEMIKSLFMLLPDEIIGMGICNGFDDTMIGDEIYTFIEENKTDIQVKLNISNKLG
ncbi:hypothetical protein [Commensalibacter nepenthis]|uniref:Uncharacterized protein n=1 Tax=Commensalibacter nepenthis TaxID=3043872 RepID=A0ABT6QC10_9PROT|nr:hypothetical protein [Commensalibacter sp. TBRC 10068]MDI2113880.1 hypothetical protein [Commensalibacter sp. TBRC 10068]